MNEIGKTLTFVAAAVVLSLSALIASSIGVRSVEEFNDQGKPFYPDFKDPSACTSLQVVDVDPVTASVRQFKVMLKNGRWVIPSHHDYPADAKDRLAQTASRVIGLTKDTIRSTKSDDHKAFGVVDPDPKQASPEGMGKRVTLRDSSDRVLADYIIGKEVKDHPDQHYVRIPGQPRTYGVVIKAEPSTRFADWIETNLLKIDTAKIRTIEIDNTKVDTSGGRLSVVEGGKIFIDRKDSAGPWTTSGLKPDEEVDPAKTSAMISALGDLKILGVRTKPPGLAEALKSTDGQESKPIGVADNLSLQTRGFYLTKRGLISNEGGVYVNCDDGIIYYLPFGEVTFAQGESLEAGDKAEGEKAKDKAKTEKKDDSSVESRFLFVMIRFDEKLIPKPIEPAMPSDFPAADPFARGAEQIRSAEAKFKADQQAYEKKIKDGKARADDLAKRFAEWYYVVPGTAYRNLVLDRKSLIHAKPPASATPPPAGGFPGLNPGAFPRPGGHP